MKTIFHPFFALLGNIIKVFNISVKQDGFNIKFPKIMKPYELGFTILGTYEKNEKLLVKKHIRKDDSVLEMGACIGVISLVINRILLDKKKQVSIEPNPQVFNYLLENKKANKGEFFTETCILSTSPQVDFHLGGKAFLGSSILGTGEKITVPGKTYKELINQYFEFTAIVMDIEGGELEFFRSFPLRDTLVRLVIWETHENPLMLSSEELLECYELLRKNGFYFKDKSGNVEVWGRN